MRDVLIGVAVVILLWALYGVLTGDWFFDRGWKTWNVTNKSNVSDLAGGLENKTRIDGKSYPMDVDVGGRVKIKNNITRVSPYIKGKIRIE